MFRIHNNEIVAGVSEIKRRLWDGRNKCTLGGIVQWRYEMGDVEENCWREFLDYVIGDGLKFPSEGHEQFIYSLGREGKFCSTE